MGPSAHSHSRDSQLRREEMMGQIRLGHQQRCCVTVPLANWIGLEAEIALDLPNAETILGAEVHLA